jgi:type VI secretion system secreted protein Hcp
MALDAYIQIEGIEGESTDANHIGWIQLMSYSHSIQNETTGQSGGGHHTGGRVMHGDLTLVKSMDASSPILMLACCQGKSHPTATLELCRSGASGIDAIPFQKVELTDVTITSVTPQANDGGGFPTETFTLTYRTITWTYTKTDTTGNPTGEVTGGWDLAANKTL